MFLFGADPSDDVIEQLDSMPGFESDGTQYRAVWMPLHAFAKGKAILYPEGLLDMLTSPVMAGIAG